MAKVTNSTTKKAIAEAAPVKLLSVRVLRKGDGKVYTGRRVADGVLTYEKGETFSVAEDVALSLEDRGWVEVIEASPEPKKAAA